MANFKKSYSQTSQNEGGYVNDRNDSGGETYKGIARKSWPAWEGWRLIDLATKDSNINNTLQNNDKLQVMVESFYKNNFWDTIGGDLIKDDYVAFLIYDAHVNAGGYARLWVQRVLNVMNQGGKTWPDIKVDGGIGPQTLNCLNACIMLSGMRKIFIMTFSALRIAAFVESAEKNPVNETFYTGWLMRMQLNDKIELGF